MSAVVLCLSNFGVLCCCVIVQAIKSIERIGLDAMAAEAGIDLWKLPFEDARPERLAYLAENKGKVPVVSAAGQTSVKYWSNFWSKMRKRQSNPTACRVQYGPGGVGQAARREGTVHCLAVPSTLSKLFACCTHLQGAVPLP